MTAVDVRIHELQIEGVDAAGRHDIARGLQIELRRLLATHGIPAGLLSGIPASPPPLRHLTSSPVDLGRDIARALYEGWR